MTVVAFVVSVDQDQLHKMCSLVYDLQYPLRETLYVKKQL